MPYSLVKLNKYNHNLYLSLIYILWLLSIFSYFFLDDYIKAGNLEEGVKLGNDSYFYLKESKNILNGESSFLDYKSKFGYLLFLIPFLYFDLPLICVVFFQIFLTAVGSFCLYKITEKYFGKLSGLICISLFLFYFPIQIRNFYILTEMVFIDLSLILIYFVNFFKKQYIPIIILLLAALVSIRPNGILFLFSFVFCTFNFLIKNKKKLFFMIYIIMLLILILPIFNILNAYMRDLNLIEQLNKGIIWGWSFENKTICKQLCLSTELIDNNYSNTLLGYFQFILINFYEYFKIFFLKIFWLIARARPYYSDLHNYYILFFNFILYPSFIYGFLKKPKNNFSMEIILLFIMFSIVLVGLTFADWSGRFSLYFLPFIMIFSSYGLSVFVKKILKMVN